MLSPGFAVTYGGRYVISGVIANVNVAVLIGWAYLRLLYIIAIVQEKYLPNNKCNEKGKSIYVP